MMTIPLQHNFLNIKNAGMPTLLRRFSKRVRLDRGRARVQYWDLHGMTKCFQGWAQWVQTPGGVHQNHPPSYPTPSQLGIPRSGSVSAHCIPDAKPPLPHGNLDPRHSGEPTTERRYQLMAQNLAVPATWHIDPCDQQVGLPVGMSSWN